MPTLALVRATRVVIKQLWNQYPGLFRLQPWQISPLPKAVDSLITPKGVSKCQKRSKTEGTCRRWAVWHHDGQVVCTTHLPPELRQAYNDKGEHLHQEDEGRRIARIRTKLRLVHDQFQVFREAKPPSDLVKPLLQYFQNGVCLMCWARGVDHGPKGLELKVDHDHDTGMMRAWLCRSCNAQEKACERQGEWPSYRELAPANGLGYMHAPPTKHSSYARRDSPRQPRYHQWRHDAHQRS